MNPNTLSALLDRNGTNAVLAHVYGEASDRAADRLRHAVCRFSDLYGNNRDLSVFSVPGRSELSGNHTDHNHGRVIAASVDLDMIAVVSPRDDACIRITSEGFEEIVVNIDSYVTPCGTVHPRLLLRACVLCSERTDCGSVALTHT